MALRLAEEGAAVAVLDIEAATGTAQQIIDAGGRATSYVVDISDQQRVTDVVPSITADLGSADHLVDSAGHPPPSGAPGHQPGGLAPRRGSDPQDSATGGESTTAPSASGGAGTRNVMKG